MSDQPCPQKLIGVEIHYCDANGDETSVFVNMNAVGAIAWSDKEVGKKGVRPGPCRPLPKGRKGSCDKDVAAAPPDRNLCWWNGTDWVCGEA